MPLKVPIQGAINRSIRYERQFVRIPVIDAGGSLMEILLEEVGGSLSGHLPDDPPPVSRISAEYRGGIDCRLMAGYSQAICAATRGRL